MARSTGAKITWTVLGSAACAAAALFTLKKSPQFRLDGKVVFVTGGSRGLGCLRANLWTAEPRLPFAPGMNRN